MHNRHSFINTIVDTFHHCIGFCFRVVSSSHSIEDIQNAIFSFIDSVPALLHMLTPEVFQNHVSSQMSEKQRPDASLYDAAGFNWYEITEGDVDFNLRSAQVEYLSDSNVMQTKQTGLKEFAEQLLVRKRRLLLLHSSVPTPISVSGKSQSASATITPTAPLPSAFLATFGREAVKVTVATVKDVHLLGSVTIPRQSA